MGRGTPVRFAESGIPSTPSPTSLPSRRSCDTLVATGGYDVLPSANHLLPSRAPDLSISLATAQNTRPEVAYVPTTDEAVQAMLKLADVKKTDVVYDLGCGDGRIVIAAAKSTEHAA
jgi:hypothetical protein